MLCQVFQHYSLVYSVTYDHLNRLKYVLFNNYLIENKILPLWHEQYLRYDLQHFY